MTGTKIDSLKMLIAHICDIYDIQIVRCRSVDSYFNDDKVHIAF